MSKNCATAVVLPSMELLAAPPITRKAWHHLGCKENGGAYCEAPPLYDSLCVGAMDYFSLAMASMIPRVKSQDFCTAGMWQHSLGECTFLRVGP